MDLQIRFIYRREVESLFHIFRLKRHTILTYQKHPSAIITFSIIVDGEVENKKPKKYIFPCDRWLDVGEDDNAIERELMRAEKEKTKVEGKYRV